MAMDSESHLLNLMAEDPTTTGTTHCDVRDQQNETTFNEAVTCTSDSCLTTAELQQHWRAVKQEIRSIKLLFEIPSTRIVEHIASRYVVYQIVVIKSGSYDYDHVAIERRYSDFLHLHQQLLRDFNEELEDVTFPRKKLMGNFSEENITERRVALCDYLTQLYTRHYVRYSQEFIAFFTHSELKTAYKLLRAGRYPNSLEIFQNVLVLQEKLCSHDLSLLIPTLCALVVCQRDIENFQAAFQAGHRALPTIRRYGPSKYRVPLLEAMVDLGYKLQQPVAQLQEEQIRVQNSPHTKVLRVSLKELVIKEFT